ncbi:cytochrome c maturation protein CcmE [Endozoicomonas lisbonensis]|uniref:Cytochrome c-type biogenesis protein CcmE n=1 Tax=Endozoicomonas lisbonensis TaxID=3120522 RepID=A0ABV2SNT0_9GAMM
MDGVSRQRLTLVSLLIVGAVLAATLVVFALSQNINLFFSPSEMVRGEAPVGQTIRGGGVVVSGTVERDPDSLLISFLITDGAHEVEVEYTGILPDLFREDQGIVGTGTLDDSGRFVAEELLAKHDENYTPVEVERALSDAETGGGKHYDS